MGVCVCVCLFVDRNGIGLGWVGVWMGVEVGGEVMMLVFWLGGGRGGCFDCLCFVVVDVEISDGGEVVSVEVYGILRWLMEVLFLGNDCFMLNNS